METQELTVIETAKLENLEEVIAAGFRSCFEVGRALKQIHDEKLYRAFGTFAEYCEGRLHISDSYALKFISAAEVLAQIESDNCLISPANEAQVRPLGKLPEEDRVAAWEEAVATAPDGKVTAAHVESIVAARLPDSTPADWTLAKALEHLADAIEKISAKWPAEHANMLPLQLEALADRYSTEVAHGHG